MQLGIGRAAIERIENDFRKTARITFEILVLWREGACLDADTVAMKEELCDALEHINLAIVADRVRRGEWWQTIGSVDDCQGAAYVVVNVQ